MQNKGLRGEGEAGSRKLLPGSESGGGGEQGGLWVWKGAGGRSAGSTALASSADQMHPVFEPQLPYCIHGGRQQLGAPEVATLPNRELFGPWCGTAAVKAGRDRRVRAGARAPRAARSARPRRLSRFPSPPSFQGLRGCALRGGSVASSNHTTAICCPGRSSRRRRRRLYRVEHIQL